MRLPSRSSLRGRPSPRRLRDLVLFLALPLAIVPPFLSYHYRRGLLGVDFERTLLPAARAVAAGASPYPGFGYPPLAAFALTPFTLVPGPDIVFAALLVAAVPASLWLLGVRDWRCYGAAFLWTPVLAAVQTGNVTILLLLGTAICWRRRDSLCGVAAAGGLAIAAKILCWPLLAWLAATRRVAAAVWTAAVAVAVTLALWGLLGFSGLAGYPASLSRLGRSVASDSYTVKAILVDAGVDPALARAAWAAVALAALVAAFLLGRRGDDRRAFGLAAFAMILASPIVWLHSYALLLAPVAVMRPRLSPAWLVPIAFVLVPGTGNGEAWQTATALGVAASTVALALAPEGRRQAAAPAALDPRASTTMPRPR
ncbi:glycosyltransferase 87 family protein [Gaiella occulta]|uniref:glycosyltransferase 87 family protein n=1 Tax=Gaiella occulta TaxID=1002870 RepID=UPI0015EFFE80|nr:glycosyltransferase 87 family protein [Gaiella occulta]